MTVHVAESVVGPLLELRCPACEHLHADDYESIDSDVVGEMCCESCGINFGFVVATCPSCEGETAFTWRAATPVPAFRNWPCACCRVELSRHEASNLHSQA